MITPHAMCGMLVLLSYSCSFSSNNGGFCDCVSSSNVDCGCHSSGNCNDCPDSGCCQNKQDIWIRFQLQGLAVPASLMLVTVGERDRAATEPSRCVATLTIGSDSFVLAGSFGATEVDLESAEVSLVGKSTADAHYAGTLKIGDSTFAVSLTGSH